MRTGALLLSVMTAVLIVDVGIALWMRERANRVESGEITSSCLDPQKSRRAANMILINAPIIWIITAIICFGVIPTGIDTIHWNN